MNIQTTLERITPAIAEAYLLTNTMNRPPRNSHVAKLAADMVSGNYQINGSTIVFNGDGTLLDGQHRLMAIVEAGVPVDMIVVRGVSKVAMKTIDANISRKAHDVAQMMGFTSASNLVGTVRLLMALKTGRVADGKMATTSQIMEFLRLHPHLQDSVTAVSRLQKIAPVTSLAALHYMAFYVGGYTEEAARALKVVETGIPSYPNDAIHAFRERYMRDKKEFQGGLEQRLRAFWTIALSWNDFLEQEPRLLCRTQKAEVRVRGVDYSKL